MSVLWLIAAILCAYFLGALPFAYWVGKWFAGINIMEHGSGNVGATNTVRVLGLKLGITVLVLDAAKGYLAAFLGGLAYGQLGGVICGVVAVVGHTLSVFIHFKGGKGVSTTAGVILCVAPIVGILGLTTWFVVGRITSYVSVASICAATMAIILCFVFPEAVSVRIMICVICLYIIIKHRSNIKRLLNHTEGKVTWFRVDERIINHFKKK